jgi:glyoxylase-like metal-dependent hydrolase (beta-lactamase superfamily II)
MADGRRPQVVLTNREGHGRIRRLQERLGWPVLVQEQEAYLLPGVNPLHTFAEEHRLVSGLRLLWTPGPTPGSCVVHAPAPWNVLFCGRLLVPVAVGVLAGLQHRRTFHWPRQQRSLARLRDWVGSDPLLSLASGAGLGALRGERLPALSAWRDAVDSETDQTKPT